MATHSEEASAVADTIVRMRDGRIEETVMSMTRLRSSSGSFCGPCCASVPGRALILFAVALGDAAVVAIDLAGDAAGRLVPFLDGNAGRKNDFEVTAAGGVPEAVVGANAAVRLCT